MKEAIVIHGSSLIEGSRPNDIDMVSTTDSISPEGIRSLSRWVGEHGYDGLPIDLKRDASAGVEMFRLPSSTSEFLGIDHVMKVTNIHIPSPLGVQVPYEVLVAPDNALVDVTVKPYFGVAAAIRAFARNRAAAFDYIGQTQRFELSIATNAPDMGIVDGIDKYCEGLVALQSAVEKSPDHQELLAEMPFTSTLGRLADSSQALSRRASKKVKSDSPWTSGSTLVLRRDGASFQGVEYGTEDEIDLQRHLFGR